MGVERSKVFVVAGVPGAGKSSVLKKVYELRKDIFDLISFGTEMLNICIERKLVQNRDEMRKLPLNTQYAIQHEAASRIAFKGGNILLDTHFSILTPGGYIPGLPPEILDILKPRGIILVDAHETEIAGRRRLDKTRARDIDSPEMINEHKIVNRAFAASYAARTGAIFQIIHNRTGLFDESVEKMVFGLDFILKPPIKKVENEK